MQMFGLLARIDQVIAAKARAAAQAKLPGAM